MVEEHTHTHTGKLPGRGNNHDRMFLEFFSFVINLDCLKASRLSTFVSQRQARTFMTFSHLMKKRASLGTRSSAGTANKVDGEGQTEHLDGKHSVCVDRAVIYRLGFTQHEIFAFRRTCSNGPIVRCSRKHVALTHPLFHTRTSVWEKVSVSSPNWYRSLSVATNFCVPCSTEEAAALHTRGRQGEGNNH